MLSVAVDSNFQIRQKWKSNWKKLEKIFCYERLTYCGSTFRKKSNLEKILESEIARLSVYAPELEKWTIVELEQKKKIDEDLKSSSVIMYLDVKSLHGSDSVR